MMIGLKTHFFFELEKTEYVNTSMRGGDVFNLKIMLNTPA